MKDKIGFNLIFAMMAFPLGLALFKDIDFSNFTFKKPALDIIYLITFCILIYLMLKKKKTEPGK